MIRRYLMEAVKRPKQPGVDVEEAVELCNLRLNHSLHNDGTGADLPNHFPLPLRFIGRSDWMIINLQVGIFLIV